MKMMMMMNFFPQVFPFHVKFFLPLFILGFFAQSKERGRKKEQGALACSLLF